MIPPDAVSELGRLGVVAEPYHPFPEPEEGAMNIGRPVRHEPLLVDQREPIAGYRVWRVANGRLLGPSRGAGWPADGPLWAWCPRSSLYDERPVPHARCECGIYAMRSAGSLGRLVAAGPRVARSNPELVLGEVYLWGRVFEHDLGWRAEWARPAGLYLTWDPSQDAAMRDLLERYGLDVRVRGEDEPPRQLVPA
jgi:hypothetical protein